MEAEAEEEALESRDETERRTDDDGLAGSR